MRAGSSKSACASASARPGSPGRSARSASGAVGWTWIVAGATPPEDRARRIGSRANGRQGRQGTRRAGRRRPQRRHAGVPSDRRAGRDHARARAGPRRRARQRGRSHERGPRRAAPRHGRRCALPAEGPPRARGPRRGARGGGRHAEAAVEAEGHLSVGAEFASPKEFREVIDRIFAMMDDDPDMGPKLRDADVPQRFEFDDVDMVVNIRAAAGGEDGNLHWEWTDDVDWEPKVRMTMSSETANRYFQGKENVAMAIARRRIKAGGDVKAALSLIPVTKPIYPRYRELVAAEYPHLRV